MMVGVVSLCLLSFLAIDGLAQQAVKEVKIGVAGPMKAVFGRDHWRGASIAQEEINKAGGVTLGGTKVPIKLVKVDTNEIASVSDAVVAVERAADEVHFFVGTQRSESALAMQDVAMKYKKIFMLCGAVHPDLIQILDVSGACLAVHAGKFTGDFSWKPRTGGMYLVRIRAGKDIFLAKIICAK